jgi:hypothetical protein
MLHLIVVRRGQAGAHETLKTGFEQDSHAGVRGTLGILVVGIQA